MHETVTVEIKNGRIIAIHPINHGNTSSSSSHPNNTHRLEIAVLEVAAVPQNYTGENATKEKLAAPVSRIESESKLLLPFFFA